MNNMYTWAVRAVRRNLTVADMRAAKGKRKRVQVTAGTEEEGANAVARAATWTAAQTWKARPIAPAAPEGPR